MLQLAAVADHQPIERDSCFPKPTLASSRSVADHPSVQEGIELVGLVEPGAIDWHCSGSKPEKGDLQKLVPAEDSCRVPGCLTCQFFLWIEHLEAETAVDMDYVNLMDSWDRKEMVEHSMPVEAL